MEHAIDVLQKQITLLEQKIHILNSTVYDCNFISNRILKRNQGGFEGDRKDIELISKITKEVIECQINHGN